MNKPELMVLATAILFSTGAAQDAIENPAKPLNDNAGRVVTLKEEMRIEDTGEGYYFKNPHYIRVSPRGDIFIRDGQEQALQFNAQGRFVRNLFKKGQGPGELTSLTDVWASRANLFLIGHPIKILVFDYDGNLLKELSLRELGWGHFILADMGGFLIYKGGRPDPSAGGGFKDIPWNVVEISPEGNLIKALGPFYIRGFVELFESGATSVTGWNRFQAVALDGSSLFLNYTPEYLVEKLVTNEGAVVRRFERPYTRVRRKGESGISGPGGNTPAPPEFDPDIYALHVVDGKIWVQTSTVTEGKGILFDVFDPEGRYADSFYLQSLSKDPFGKPANMVLTIAGGFAYFSEKTDDDLIVIKKCRLVGL